MIIQVHFLSITADIVSEGRNWTILLSLGLDGTSRRIFELVARVGGVPVDSVIVDKVVCACIALRIAEVYVDGENLLSTAPKRFVDDMSFQEVSAVRAPLNRDDRGAIRRASG